MKRTCAVLYSVSHTLPDPAFYLIILPQMRILQRILKRTTDTFPFISHTKNVLLFKFRCNNFTAVTIIKEMPVSVASGTHCIFMCGLSGSKRFFNLSHKRIFWKKQLLYTKCSFRFPLQMFIYIHLYIYIHT